MITYDIHWRVDTGVSTYFKTYGHIRDLGLEPCPYDGGDEDSLLAIRIWAALYRERRAAFDAWATREARLADAAIGDVRARVVGREAQHVLAARGAWHVAAFGCDEMFSTIDAVLPDVGPYSDDRPFAGATVIVKIRASYGGGDGWIGSLGERVYHRSIPVEGRTPWVVPPQDEGLAAVLVRRAARGTARRALREAAVGRIEHVIEALYSRAHTPGWSWRDRARWEAVRDRLRGQVARIDPVDWRRVRLGPADVPEIEIWPKRSRKPARRLPILAQEERGWYALRAALAAGAPARTRTGSRRSGSTSEA